MLVQTKFKLVTIMLDLCVQLTTVYSIVKVDFTTSD